MVRMAFSEPIRQTLSGLGVGTAYYKRAGIPIYADYSPYTLVPERPWWVMLDEISRREAIPELGLLAAEPVSFVDVRSISAQLQGSETLRELLLRFIEAVRYQSNNARFRLVESADHAMFCNLTPSLLTGESEAVQIPLFQFRGMIQLVQRVLGGAWRPRRVRLPFRQSVELVASPILGADHVLFDQPYAAFDLSPAELDTPVSARGCETMALPSKSELPDLPPTAFLACLRRLVDYHLCEQVPDLKTVATICDLSPRTLQRRLADQGLTFAGLLDWSRQQRSKHLLVDTDRSLTDIAHVQGYSDYQKFSRAFTRWTGETPRRYRLRRR